MYLIRNSAALLSLVFFLFSCHQKEEDPDPQRNESPGISKKSNVIAGSETELELVRGLINISGSESLKGFDVLGGGSKFGLEQFINGEAKLANSSIRMSNEEKQKLKENGAYGLIEIIFALDAVAVITNTKVGVDSLSVMELKEVFAGEITNWKELGGEDLPIKVFRRNDDSGTNAFFRSKVLQGAYGDNVSIVTSNDEMLTTIETVPGSIGYLGVGTIRDKQGKPSEKVWAVNIYIDGDDARSPYSFNDVVTENYYLARPLYQYFMIEDKADFQDLIMYELSPDGQVYVKEQGFFPITEEYAAMNEFYLKKLSE